MTNTHVLIRVRRGDDRPQYLKTEDNGQPAGFIEDIQQARWFDTAKEADACMGENFYLVTHDAGGWPVDVIPLQCAY